MADDRLAQTLLEISRVMHSYAIVSHSAKGTQHGVEVEFSPAHDLLWLGLALVMEL